MDSVLVCWCYDLKGWLGSGWPEFEAEVRPVDSIPLQDLSRVDGAKYQEVLVNVRRPRKVGTRGRRVEHELGDEVTNVLGVAGGSGELIKTPNAHRPHRGSEGGSAGQSPGTIARPGRQWLRWRQRRRARRSPQWRAQASSRERARRPPASGSTRVGLRRATGARRGHGGHGSDRHHRGAGSGSCSGCRRC